MVNNKTLDRDLIIHPGETLGELLADRGMAQRELATRCGVTEKHISSVLAGKSNITASFAKKLEYVFGVDASFWLNLQNIYDEELLDFEDSNNISQEEIIVSKNFKELCKFAEARSLLPKNLNAIDLVLELRRFMGVTNLLDIPEVSYCAAYRVECSTSVDRYVLFGWQMLCERITEKQDVASNLDLDKLKRQFASFKALMSEDAKVMRRRMKEILASCGIAFEIMPNFKGAPVQGFIKQSRDRVILCMTIRRKYADIFWFSFFHEIGHLLHDDIKRVFIDFESVNNEQEQRANKFAANTMLDKKSYKTFINTGCYTPKAISALAAENNVPEYIVYGRLANDKYLGWDSIAHQRRKYTWGRN